MAAVTLFSDDEQGAPLLVPLPRNGSEFARAASEAFRANDIEASRALHDAPTTPKTQAQELHAGAAAAFIKSVVYGGLDGCITTASTIAAAAGGQLGLKTVLVLGVANLVADGLSMGLGDMLSSAAEERHVRAEWAARAQQCQQQLPAVTGRLQSRLQRKGLTPEDAQELVGILSQPAHRDFFHKFLLYEEAGLELPAGELGPVLHGLTTLLSFLLFGCLPLMVYVVAFAMHYQNHAVSFGLAAGATALALFLLGWTQGVITRLPPLPSAVIITASGCCAATGAYLVSWGIMHAIDTGDGGSSGECG